MADSYTLSYQPETRLLKLALQGVWNGKILDEFIVDVFDVRARVEAAAYREDKGRIMIDLSDYGVQPREISDRMAALLPVFGTHASRVAVVKSGSKLQNMQADRLLVSEKVKSFGSAAEAMAWLG